MSNNYHRTDQLTITGEQPELEKLWNGRFRAVFFCKSQNNSNTDYESIDRILPEFGSLHSAPLTADGQTGVSASVRSVYPDLRLVEVGNKYIPASGEHLVVLTYETLTEEFAQEKDDDINRTKNGLRTVARSLVAQAGTEYDKEVGVTTIQHQINEETEITLYLASAEIDDTDAYRRVAEVWAEAGILETSKATESEGVIRASTTFLAVEGTTVGPVISRQEGDYEGLKTITVSTLQNANGDPIGDGSLVNSVSGLSSWTYPGVVDVLQRTVLGNGGGRDYESKSWDISDTPVQCMVKSTTYVFFQTEPSLVAADYIYSGAQGLWNPTQWAKGSSYGLGYNYRPFLSSRGFRSYRAAGTYDLSFDEGTTAAGPNYLINGSAIFANTECGISLDGGPEDPQGNKYTIQPTSVTPAFEDMDGVSYYKKVITVADIPTQGASTIT